MRALLLATILSSAASLFGAAPRPSLTGTVLDSNDSPLAGVTVMATTPGSRSATVHFAQPASGSLKESEYTRGWGAIQVHVVGVLMLVGMLWIAYDAFIAHH